MIGYPSDITRQQFELIRPDLEAVRQRTRPRQVDLYEIFNAVLYILRTGSQWRQLPHDFPKWQTAYGYFRRWSEPIDEVGHSQLDLILKKLSIKADYAWAVRHPLHSSF
jgi:hypothetical protein